MPEPETNEIKTEEVSTEQEFFFWASRSGNRLFLLGPYESKQEAMNSGSFGLTSKRLLKIKLNPEDFPCEGKEEN